MSAPGWSARGSKVRGAVALLSILEADGREVLGRGGQLVVRPANGLNDMDRRLVINMKPELMLLSSFTAQQRAGIMRIYPGADAVDLQSCRDALNAWGRFTAQERAFLDPGLTVLDVAKIGKLKTATGGTVISPTDVHRLN